MSTFAPKWWRALRASPTVGELCAGRDNNFNLVRLIAAYAVLVSHSYPIALGRGTQDPAHALIHMSLGEWAVDVFFISSGFLIARSLELTTDLRRFARARVLRIYPALVVVVLLTVLLVGPLFTSLSVAAYFGHLDTWVYTLRNSTLVTGISHQLPGVFDGNVYPRLVNASLWTLPYEIFMYACLASVWWLAARFKSHASSLFLPAVTTVGVVLVVLQVAMTGYFASNLLRLAAAFFAGAAVYLWRNHIRLNGWVAAALVLAVVLLQPDPVWFRRAYVLVTPYLLFYLVFVPAGPVRAFNRLGDYSYGTYVYAFPVQQMVIALSPSASVVHLMTWSSVLTLLFAALSWHIIEKRALAMKGAFGRNRSEAGLPSRV